MGDAKKRRSIEFLRQQAVIESSEILGYDVSFDPNKPSLLAQGYARKEYSKRMKKAKELLMQEQKDMDSFAEKVQAAKKEKKDEVL